MTAVPPPLPPRANPDLRGQAAAEQALGAAIRSGRLHHAWLIGGRHGIGKATLAYRVARYLLAGGTGGAPPPVPRPAAPVGLFGPAPADDPPPPSTDSDLALDPDHPVFRQVRAGGHPDLLTVERSLDDKRGRLRTEILVDEVRAANHFLQHTTAGGGHRIVIVDGADRMNVNAQNTLLKSLEEPPPTALLLLVTDRPGALLPTVRSRCRKLVLAPLSDADLAGLLSRHRPDLDTDTVAALAALAEGSIGTALNLALIDGLALYRSLIELFEALPDVDWRRVHAFADRVAGANADDAYETVATLLVGFLARLARAHAVGGNRAAAAGAPAGPAEEDAIIRRLVGAHGRTAARTAARLDHWVEVWDKVGRLFRTGDAVNLDRKQVVLNAVQAIAAAA